MCWKFSGIELHKHMPISSDVVDPRSGADVYNGSLPLGDRHRKINLKNFIWNEFEYCSSFCILISWSFTRLGYPGQWEWRCQYQISRSGHNYNYLNYFCTGGASRRAGARFPRRCALPQRRHWTDGIRISTMFMIYCILYWLISLLTFCFSFYL
jgi:hypothetical protein